MFKQVSIFYIHIYIEIWCHYAFSKSRKMGGIARAPSLWHLFHKEHSDISGGRYLRVFLQFFKSILGLNFCILRRSKANGKYRSSWLFFIAVNAQCFQKINMVSMPLEEINMRSLARKNKYSLYDFFEHRSNINFLEACRVYSYKK